MTGTLHLPVLDQRPRTRGECADVPRPCPWASCRYSLLVDIDAHGHAHEVEVPEGSTACALDVADDGESTLEDIAEMSGVTRERIRQIEAKAFAAVRGRRSGKILEELADEGKTIDKGRSAGRSREYEEAKTPWEPKAEFFREEEDYTAGRTVSFFSESPDADRLVCDVVWRIFAKDSTARGFDARSAVSKRVSAWRKNNPRKGLQPFAKLNAIKAKETTMPVTKMTPRLERVLAIYREGTTSPTEIAAKLGGEMTTSNISTTLTALRKLGQIPPGQPGGRGAAKPMPARVNPRKLVEPERLPPVEALVVHAPVFADEPAGPPPAPPALVAAVEAAARTSVVVEYPSPLARLRSELAACEKRSGALRTAIAVLAEGGIT